MWKLGKNSIGGDWNPLGSNWLIVQSETKYIICRTLIYICVKTFWERQVVHFYSALVRCLIYCTIYIIYFTVGTICSRKQVRVMYCLPDSPLASLAPFRQYIFPCLYLQTSKSMPLVRLIWVWLYCNWKVYGNSDGIQNGPKCQFVNYEIYWYFHFT